MMMMTEIMMKMTMVVKKTTMMKMKIKDRLSSPPVGTAVPPTQRAAAIQVALLPYLSSSSYRSSLS